jgi:excinuclease ABC subunit B
MYADKITDSMQRTMDETNRKREKQLRYNEENNITPEQIKKSVEAIHGQTSVADTRTRASQAYIENEEVDIAADPVVQYMSKEQLQKAMNNTRRKMEKAAKELDFIEAARLRDEMFALEKIFKGKYM